MAKSRRWISERASVSEPSIGFLPSTATAGGNSNQKPEVGINTTPSTVITNCFDQRIGPDSVEDTSPGNRREDAAKTS